MDAREVDVVVIGAGAVGENVADRTAQGGLSTLIVEAELVGGECSYWACMPSKALLRPAAALRAARAVAGAAEAVTGELDPRAVLRRRDRITHDHTDDSQVAWLEGAGIELVRGHARFVGPRRIVVTASDGTTVEIEARHAIAVCTGSVPVLPDIPGLAEIDPWTSRDATSASEIPSSLAVLGGGVVGCELATAYASLGSRVTLLARSGLLRGQEPFAREAVEQGLAAAGVDVRIGTEPVSAHQAEKNAVLTLDDGGRVLAERVLVATGRTGRTGDLGLEALGIAAERRIEVDDTMQVPGFSWLYAVGDVNGRVLLTHQGKYQARAAGDAIVARAAGRPVDDAPWGTHVATADHRTVPQVTFTDPEVASVGLTAEAAESEGLRTRVLDYDLSWVAGASVYSDDYRGQARAVVDLDREVLVGATFVGPDVGEMLQAATIAIAGEVPLARLWHAVPAYPTVSEVWLRWLEEFGRPATEG
ncbi:NAD(P)/FAD-dependent oxidoreductase [Homoserinibacter sp. GY 40078]|uniref:dihydrolipoyl dehydrogenase family protein n=1 Tax=Homoserinibacter sp. GY 40078 TaxID=2603275 RepID=UPI0011CC8D73|nr:NAD(P)/FAD-dependent oxidoreductase [Homoserinibacter sp. GY 40078]TXK17237.1 NAD(P)/FAD-dependent oxidoreductase [Homoserinibacter sp. GY 40078]